MSMQPPIWNSKDDQEFLSSLKERLNSYKKTVADRALQEKKYQYEGRTEPFIKLFPKDIEEHLTRIEDTLKEYETLVNQRSLATELLTIAREINEVGLKLGYKIEVEWRDKRRENSTGFEGYQPKQENNDVTGKQVKKTGAGMYERWGKNWYIKSSRKYPADDIAEVVTSHLMGSLIGVERAVPYEFISNSNRPSEQYVISEVRSNETLSKSLHLQKGLGWTRGWLGSNPRTKSNKEVINNIINTRNVKIDMANILAACLLLKEEDCQVGNILFYLPDTNSPNKFRVCKFDNGWGMANICKPKHQVVNLFGRKHFFGTRGTHERTFIPTNHFVDYPYVIRSQEFVDALRAIATTSEKEMNDQIKKQLENISNKFKPKEAELKALKDFASHIGASVFHKNPSTESVKTIIRVSLEKALKARTKSMKMLATLLEFSLSISPTDKNKPVNSAQQIEEIKEQLKRVSEAIQEYYPGKTGKQLMKLMPAIEPNLKSMLKKALKLATKQGVEIDVGPLLKDLLPKKTIFQKLKDYTKPQKPSKPKHRN